MQRKWIAVAAAVVGIGLAAVLIPMPDTGDDVPEYSSPDVDVAEAPAPPADDGDVVARTPNAAGDTRDEAIPADVVAVAPPPGTKMRPGATYAPRGEPIPGAVNPIAQERKELREGTPEGQAAARMDAPWQEVARAATDLGDEDLAAAAQELANDVRAWRTTLDFEAFPDLVAKQKEMVDALRESGVADDPAYAQSVAQIAAVVRDLERQQAE